jgi:ATP-dependent RNA helicase DHX29
VVACDSDIEPDDLVPVYIQTKAKLFELERSRLDNGPRAATADEDSELEVAKLIAKADRIEKDILFDKQLAGEEWKVKRVMLEKDFAASRKQRPRENEEQPSRTPHKDADSSVNGEAERIAAEILALEEDDDDMAVSDLFASLPVTEVDSVTGKTTTVINGKDGERTVIRDFGKWTGVSPERVLEEACRSRCVSDRANPEHQPHAKLSHLQGLFC